jgi:hypothetical protein
MYKDCVCVCVGGGGEINYIWKCGNTFLLVDSESHIFSMKLWLFYHKNHFCFCKFQTYYLQNSNKNSQWTPVAHSHWSCALGFSASWVGFSWMPTIWIYFSFYNNLFWINHAISADCVYLSLIFHVTICNKLTLLLIFFYFFSCLLMQIYHNNSIFAI